MRLARAVLSAICVVLLCAACIPGPRGDNRMNPEQKAAVEVAEHLHSIEEFERDVEPAIVAARNEFLTQDTIVGLFANDFIYETYPDSTPLYELMSRLYMFSETDADRIRDVYDAKLKPLGFTLWEKHREGMVLLVWTNASYAATVDVVVHAGTESRTAYYTGLLRSDGSSENPTVFLPLEGREPEWLTPELTEKYRQE